jgi:hypothetical protein
VQFLAAPFSGEHVMKIRITLKDPDGIDDAKTDAEERCGKEVDLSRWVLYGDYITVEIDTKTGETRVVPINE